MWCIGTHSHCALTAAAVPPAVPCSLLTIAWTIADNTCTNLVRLCCCWCPLQLEDLKQFRQWDSKTPGHPENFLTPGVEVTTGTAC
jgi:hypothetical protein